MKKIAEKNSAIEEDLEKLKATEGTGAAICAAIGSVLGVIAGGTIGAIVGGALGGGVGGYFGANKLRKNN